MEYMYAFVERCGENAVIIFRFDDPEEAIKVLTGQRRQRFSKGSGFIPCDFRGSAVLEFLENTGK